MKILYVFCSILVLLSLGGCTHFYYRIDAKEIAVHHPPGNIAGPLKVHLSNGDIILFPNGAEFSYTTIDGDGTLYSLSYPTTQIFTIPRDSVVVMQRYKRSLRTLESFYMSLMSYSIVASIGALIAAISLS